MSAWEEMKLPIRTLEPYEALSNVNRVLLGNALSATAHDSAIDSMIGTCSGVLTDEIAVDFEALLSTDK